MRAAALRVLVVTCIAMAPFGSRAYVITQITDDLLAHQAPDVSGSTVVYWQQEIGGDGSSDLYVWADGSAVELPSPTFANGNARISGSRIAFQGGDGSTSSYELYEWDGSQVVQLTDNDVLDGPLDYYGDVLGHVQSIDGEFVLHLLGENGSMSLNRNGVIGEATLVMESWVAWSESDGNDSEVYLWDGAGIVQLSDNDTIDFLPEVDGNRAVWVWFDGNDTEILMYDGSEIIQLTDNDINDTNPAVWGNDVVWRGRDSTDIQDPWHLYHWDGAAIHEISSELWTTIGTGPRIDSGNVVFSATTPTNGRYQIFMATIPEPAAGWLLACGLVAVSAARRCRGSGS